MDRILDRINCPDDIKNLNKKQLERLAAEIRRFLVKNVSETGGHLASNLGIVELTLALAYCYDMPKDKVIYDVGHQSYVHKIITGRKDRFKTLRQLDGLSGFPEPKESEYDLFATGHSSTSISSAIGVAAARDLSGEKFNVVAVIGDGSMTGGLAYEGINNVGLSGKNITVILNDNQMSISENVGAMSKHLNDIRTMPSYLKAKSNVHNVLDKIPVVGEKATKAIGATKDLIKFAVVPGSVFEKMGFTYIGPVDGHDIEELIEVISRAKFIEGPVLIDVVTKKGKGVPYAEKNPSLFHGVGKFDRTTGEIFGKSGEPIFSDIFGEKLCEMAEDDDKIVAITAAMADGTGLSGFEKAYPERFFDVGIAEQHAVTFAAGMAKMGYKPFFAVYSTFLQRAYDQIIHDVCLQNLGVTIAIDRAGIVGADGKTHQGVFDMAFLNHMPNMTIMSPKNKSDLEAMLLIAKDLESPCAIRYPKEACKDEEDKPIEFGKAQVYKEGIDIAILTEGTMFYTGKEVYDKVYNALKGVGGDPAFVHFPFIKPLDEEIIKHICERCHRIYTIEDGVLNGGFGESVRRVVDGNAFARVKCFGVPDKFVEHGTRKQIFERYGLDSDTISEIIIKEFGE